MDYKAKVGTELYFSTSNEPGTMASWTNYLNEYGINIEAISAYAADGNKSYYRFVTSDNAKAKSYLAEKGYKVEEYDVVYLPAYNKPGYMYGAAAAMAEKGIDVSYTYTGYTSDNSYYYIVFNTSDAYGTEKALNEYYSKYYNK